MIPIEIKPHETLKRDDGFASQNPGILNMMNVTS
jgi:hypothetical protein